MTVLIKNKEQIEKIREVAKLAADTLEQITPLVQPGVTTLTLDQWCHNYITKVLKAVPAPLNYHGFPKSICTSVNQEVCHGIPSSKVKLKQGDIINIDVTLQKGGYYADTSKMFLLGHCSPETKKLVQVTKEALYLAIKRVKPGIKLGIIGQTIQNYVDRFGFSIVENYCGHGVGLAFHEEPNVLHYANSNKLVLEPGMIFTIEPMINAGTHLNRELKNNWTVVTKDGKNSAQWEHTILVTTSGYEVLTLREEERTEFEAI